MKTVCVEKEKLLGGTCLREGCIPSKYLLNVSHKFYEAKNEFRKNGLLLIGNADCDINQIQRNKDSVINLNCRGVEYLFKKYGTILESGKARIIDKSTVEVKRNNGSSVTYVTKNLIIASGSQIFNIPKLFPIDEEVIVSSRCALNFKTVPKNLCIIGAGVIGLEMGNCWNGFGSNVTIADISNSLCGGTLDAQVDRTLQMQLRKMKIQFMLGVKSTCVRRKGDKAIVTINDGKNEKDYEYDKVLVAIGRKPKLDGFGFENLNLKVNKNGTVYVDERFQTSCPNVYAIGDIIKGPQLAHKASTEGVLCVEGIANPNKKMNGLDYNTVPNCIHTTPEVASFGLMENQAKKLGIKVKVGMFPYSANSRARCINETAGFVKWICNDKGKVLGMTIIGPNAGDAIMEGIIAIQNGLNINQIAESIHPHPTLSEAIMEAAKAVMGKPLLI
ncbi:hypothetical protein M9Y10_003420 [Tritrichomonas musculus]|uniref:Dihydrolipoyl dehydrogenase n=1 Tax=Tritrichomonas musculus TaxID=1915356 RepID=A0ABR2JPM2_9EUKA